LRRRYVKNVMLLVLSLAVASLASAQKTALPIKVSENGRYFVDQNGGPVFWLGTTQWELFRGFSQEDARIILEESRKNGFTFVQVKLMGGGESLPYGFADRLIIPTSPELTTPMGTTRAGGFFPLGRKP